MSIPTRIILEEPRVYSFLCKQIESIGAIVFELRARTNKQTQVHYPHTPLQYNYFTNKLNVSSFTASRVKFRRDNHRRCGLTTSPYTPSGRMTSAWTRHVPHPRPTWDGHRAVTSRCSVRARTGPRFWRSRDRVPEVHRSPRCKDRVRTALHSHR